MFSFCIELFVSCILGKFHSLGLWGNGLCSALHLASCFAWEVVAQLWVFFSLTSSSLVFLLEMKNKEEMDIKLQTHQGKDVCNFNVQPPVSSFY